jgi:hypothetical protein
VLDCGQRKSLLTKRVIVVPGPDEEVAIVRRIFDEFAVEHRSMTSIAKSLNNEGVLYFNGGWDAGGYQSACSTSTLWRLASVGKDATVSWQQN